MSIQESNYRNAISFGSKVSKLSEQDFMSIQKSNYQNAISFGSKIFKTIRTRFHVNSENQTIRMQFHFDARNLSIEKNPSIIQDKNDSLRKVHELAWFKQNHQRINMNL